MADPNPVSGGTVVKATIIFNAGRNGWSENYHMHNPATGATLISAGTAMQFLIRARRLALFGDWTQEGARVQRVDIKRDGLPFAAPEIGLGQGKLGGTRIPFWNAWYFNVQDISNQVNDSRPYRGWNQECIANWDGASINGGAVPAPVTAFWQSMKNVLINPARGADGGQWTFCLRSYSRSDGDVPELPIVLVDVDDKNRLKFILQGEHASFKAGGTLIASVNRKRCVKGVSGRHLVRSVAVAGGLTTVQTASKNCCVGADLSDLTGKGRMFKAAYYPIKDFTPVRVSKHDTGRAFFVTRGRAAPKCC